jgi:hypothetical protein
MGYDDITPHLNKIATLYLKGNKRKVGWIFVDRKQATSTPPEEISFISVQKGKRLLEALENRQTEALEPFREILPVMMIERIRSSK